MQLECNLIVQAPVSQLNIVERGTGSRNRLCVFLQRKTDYMQLRVATSNEAYVLNTTV